MEWFIIVALVVLGLFLVVAEILLLPGITAAAVGAVGCFIGAVILAYMTYGAGTALLVFFGSLVLALAALLVSLRSKTLKRLTLDSNIDSVASVSADKVVPLGAEGVSLTRLAPMGTVVIDGRSWEAKSFDGYIPPKKAVVVTGFDNTAVVVQLKKTEKEKD